jgi:hypothetical protein
MACFESRGIVSGQSRGGQRGGVAVEFALGTLLFLGLFVLLVDYQNWEVLATQDLATAQKNARILSTCESGTTAANNDPLSLTADLGLDNLGSTSARWRKPDSCPTNAVCEVEVSLVRNAWGSQFFQLFVSLLGVNAVSGSMPGYVKTVTRRREGPWRTGC